MRQAPDTSTAILIAAYNASATLERAVRSALAQPEVARVVVIDDASTDRTLALAGGLAEQDPRLQVLRQEVNAGPAAARNAGLAVVREAWVGVLDADDYLLEGRVGRLLEMAGEADFAADVLLRSNGVDGVGEPADWMGESEAPRTISLAEFLEGNLGQAGRPLDLGFVKPLMRRAFLEAHALRYRQALRLGEDYELYARALALGARFVMTPATGYVSVERCDSLSKNHSELDLQRLRDCDDDLACIRPLTPAEAHALQRHRSSVDCRLQWRLLINAVKARDARAALATFHTPETSVYLTARLAEQAWLRSVGRLVRRGP